jgi:hypothetical protein
MHAQSWHGFHLWMHRCCACLKMAALGEVSSQFNSSLKTFNQS